MKRIAILSQKEIGQWSHSSRMAQIVMLWPEWERDPDLIVLIETPETKLSMSALEAMLLLLDAPSSPPEVRYELFARLLLDRLGEEVWDQTEPTTPWQLPEP
jgi:hypothetical protein